jgi:predicted O-linked N-acetylglucosamine transferase (SPINDLY family)
MASISEALLIAVAQQRAGRLDLAEEIYRRILQAQPDHLDAHNNLGITLRAQGHLAEAIACYRRALEINPAFPEGHNNLANALQSQGDLDAAVVHYRQAIELRPDYPEALSNLGIVLRLQGDLEGAARCTRRAVELRPDLAEVHSSLGDVLRDLGRHEEAIGCYQRALERRADLPEIHVNLGMALHSLGRLTEAAASFRQAIALRPKYVEANNDLGNVLKEQGDIDTALGRYDRALELQPDYAAARSNKLYCRQFRPGVTLAELAAAHAAWDQHLGLPLRRAAPPAPHDRTPDRRLRLGFVSPDLGRHPVGWFLVRVMEELRRYDCETVCYSDRALGDDITARIRQAAGTWRHVLGVSHERLAEQIRDDRIDILFDLAGHAGSTRLLVFARKPAPIQITWLGYVGTTGLSAMDYLIADRWEVPAGCESHYRERVLRMPDGYVCYEPPAYAPEVSPLPADTVGHVTLGSFNNPAKITRPIFEVWLRILERLPDARLVLKYSGVDDPTVAGRYRSMLDSAGVDPGRVELLGWSPHAELLAQYRRVDLALDPAPYGGGLTTCEALWMGVPVVTCPGETFASRHALSHMSAVGLQETIARDFDEYVELAVALASDRPRLAALRAALRQRVARSPLCDAERFTAALMERLRAEWRAWCRGA